MATKKPSQKKKINFKYVAKIGKGKDTRYFYTNAEYQAYLKGRKSTAAPTTKVETKIKETSKKASKSDWVNKGKQLINGQTKTSVDDVVSKTPSRNTTIARLIEKAIGIHRMPAEPAPAKPTAKPEIPTVKEVPPWAKDLATKTAELTHAEDQALVNPKYDPYDEATSANCTNCTAAYDLRRRGYDVEAAPYDPSDPSGQFDIRDIANWYDDTTVYDWQLTKSHEAEDVFSNMPDGSYGHMGILWSTGGGHNVVWERQGGETVIRDCQNNTTYSYTDWVTSYDGCVSDLAILRTDNREPNENIRKTVRNRKEED